MPSNFKIIYYPAAEDDIKSILDYITIDNPSAAYDLIEKIDETISALSLFPYAGSIPNDLNLKSKNYRMLIIDSYIVFYIVSEQSTTVEIMRVLSGKQNYNNLL